MRYTPEEDALIDAHFPDYATLLKKMPRRTKSGIKGRAKSLGICRPVNICWTSEEIAVVKANRSDLRRAQHLLPHRTRSAILTMSKQVTSVRLKHWSELEDDIIRRLAPSHSDLEIALFLGNRRTRDAVRVRRRALGIIRRTRSPPPECGSLFPVVSDIRGEAKSRGVRLQVLAKALKCPILDTRKDLRRLSHPTLLALVAALRGEFYAEWLD